MGRAGVNPNPRALGEVDIRYALEIDGHRHYGHIWPDPTTPFMACGLPTSFIIFPRDTGPGRLNWTASGSWNILRDDPLMLAISDYLMLWYQ